VGLRDKLVRLQKATEGLYETLHLPDGTEVRYHHKEMLEAMSAAIHQGEHRLLPYIHRTDTNRGMPGLIRALDGSRSREHGA
jgi:hypothetical protein